MTNKKRGSWCSIKDHGQIKMLFSLFWQAADKRSWHSQFSCTQNSSIECKAGVRVGVDFVMLIQFGFMVTNNETEGHVWDDDWIETLYIHW